MPYFSLMLQRFFLLVILSVSAVAAVAQLQWQDVSANFAPLPKDVQVFYTHDSLETKPFLAYYIKLPLRSKALRFTTAVGNGKRFTPSEFYGNNDSPLVVVNATFFNFDKNQNLNVVIQDGKLKAYNIPFVKGRGADSVRLVKPYRSAIGISKKRKADVAWIYADTGMRRPLAVQTAVAPTFKNEQQKYGGNGFKKWKMKTAIGGGPVLVQQGRVQVSNNEELLFAGKAINDKHPRTAMGYTNDGYLIIMAIQGRTAGVADGASLLQEAQLMIDAGCVEALNLDGGGSTCLLINGKQTIQPSDKTGQRPVPAVFIVKQR